MHLESFTLKNYRKFGEENNTIKFVGPASIVTTTEADSSLIAPSSTLVIGKNNAGKTTIAKALKFICEKKTPKVTDFNINYLKSLLGTYKEVNDNGQSLNDLPTPELRFQLNIRTDINTSGDDYINNLGSFVSIAHEDDDLVEIHIVYKVSETQDFFSKVLGILNATDQKTGNTPDFSEQMEQFYEVFKSDIDFKITYLNSSNLEVASFDPRKIISIKEIEANRHLKEGVLSEVFKKVVKFQFSHSEAETLNLQGHIDKINSEITDAVEPKTEAVGAVLKEIENNNHVNIALSGNVDSDSILRNLIKYSFADGDDFIPEDQFGLGYINLLNIIGEIVHYVDSYEDESHRNQINLLFIEEPEVFMHPQMQEFFINRIDNAVRKALASANNAEVAKSLYCQLVITTHSSHIVNSKIQDSNSFNNINYITSIDKKANIVTLTDEMLLEPDNSDSILNLKFLKKHIKYKVSELFFSDAVVFVEGMTEETLIKYYLDDNPVLKNYYISVFNINGAHGKVYFPLAEALKIPCLVITDLDIRRKKCERGEKHKSDENCNSCGQKRYKNTGLFQAGSDPDYKQMLSLDGRHTTNETIKHFNRSLRECSAKEATKLDGIEYFSKDNLYIIFQKDPINGYHATSLEEAFILTNYQNPILNNALSKCIPKIYRSIVGKEPNKDLSKLVKNSYKLQKKLSSYKSDFSSELLYRCITNDDKEQPELPNYIYDGFSWLTEQFGRV